MKYYCPRHAEGKYASLKDVLAVAPTMPPVDSLLRRDWDSITMVQNQIKRWADRNFPARTAHSALCKLMLHEIPEFALAQHDPGEYADLLILIFDIATLNGIDIPQALHDKMQVNYLRKWDWDPATGMAQHKESK